VRIQVYAEFVSEDSDKVELVYTKFISLIKGNPTIQTLLPLAVEGQVCDVNGNCIDAANDEIFKLTSKDGAFAVVRPIFWVALRLQRIDTLLARV
jgi:F-type H+-transporting ATPase subunit gamma